MELTRLPELPELDNPGNNALSELREYLLRLERSIRRALSDISESATVQAVRKISSVVTPDDISSMRDSIIRTAEEIRSVRDSISLTLENNYVAKSEIGSYAENAVQSVEIDGKGITQYFKEISLLAGRLDSAEESIISNTDGNSELSVRLSEINAYIRTGRLDTGVYGIEIGNFHDGETSPYKVRLSENRLSFFVGTTEVAYFSDNSMVIANAGVLDSLNIGNCVITPNDGITFVCN